MACWKNRALLRGISLSERLTTKCLTGFGRAAGGPCCFRGRPSAAKDVQVILSSLCEGELRVHDGPHDFRRLAPGDAFGELAALAPEARTASVTATAEQPAPGKPGGSGRARDENRAVAQAMFEVLAGYVRDQTDEIIACALHWPTSKARRDDDCQALRCRLAHHRIRVILRRLDKRHERPVARLSGRIERTGARNLVSRLRSTLLQPPVGPWRHLTICRPRNRSRCPGPASRSINGKSSPYAPRQRHPASPAPVHARRVNPARSVPAAGLAGTHYQREQPEDALLESGPVHLANAR